LAAWGPDSAALAAAAARAVDSVRSTDSLKPPAEAVRTALPGRPDWADVAGGYALDRAALALSSAADSALLDLGGQYLWVGRRPTKRSVGIAHPDNSLIALAHVELHTGSVSTLTGEHRSVTVLAPDAVGAAAWATLLYPLGCDSALALGSSIQRTPVHLVCADSTGVRWTPATPGVVLAK
jgi:thiamine biosynthesis lipoprotein ApbE